MIYLPGYYTEAGLIIKQAREMGIKQPILGADGFADREINRNRRSKQRQQYLLHRSPLQRKHQQRIK